MGWIPYFTVFTVPTGATTGRRIVIDGVKGQIVMYDANNAPVIVESAQGGTIDVGAPTTPHVIIGAVTSPAGTAQGLIEFTAPGDPHWVLPGYIAPTGELAGGGLETGLLSLYPPVYDGDPGHTLPNNRTQVLITQAPDGPSQIQAGYLASNKLTTSASGVQVTGDQSIAGNLSVTGVGNKQYKQKNADQTLANQTTPQSDNTLSAPLVANATYHVEILGHCAGPASGMQTSWSVPAGTTGVKMCTGPTSIVADGQNRGDTKMRIQGTTTLSAVIPYSVDLTASTVLHERGLITTGVTAGNMTWQWAQVTSSATVATMFSGSYMVVERVA